MMALIKHMSDYPCPWCLIPRNKLNEMGMFSDMESRTQNIRNPQLVKNDVEKGRVAVFQKGYSLNSKGLKSILRGSHHPIRNALADIVAPCLNFFDLLTPDILHEVELGVWKRLLECLIDILRSYNKNLVLLMDKRYVFLLICLNIHGIYLYY